jgi:exopolyphosphatase / guanosine-5'-triphosphate,3'-diphosphate pyrophosphatase
LQKRHHDDAAPTSTPLTFGAEMSTARFAAIDVGSNALRLRIVEADGPGTWREVAQVRAPVRLGREVFVTKRLSGAALGDACRALKSFRERMDDERVVSYRAVATSAVREAENGATLAERARREAGIELEIIEGIEEARVVQEAVLRERTFDGTALLVDVGGGSTELTVVEDGKATFAISLPLGTVRLLETYLAGRGVVDKRAQRLVHEAIDRVLSPVLPKLLRARIAHVVGTGGNVDALASLCPGRGKSADVAKVKALLAKLVTMTPAAREKAYDLRPDRADTIVPAAMIFARVADALDAREIGTPGVGVKEGILHELALRHFRAWDAAGHDAAVLEACRRLGRKFEWDEAHGEKVSALACRLFDDLADVHHLGARERLLLQAGALLHDVGDFVRYDGHHKHGYYLILHSDIMGLSPEERAIVANLARYHRKSGPSESHPNFRELGKEARAAVRGLASILRIADALDREHKGKVIGLRATVGKSRVKLEIAGAADRELEEWTVLEKAALFKDVFGLDVTLEPASDQDVEVVPTSTRITARTPAA